MMSTIATTRTQRVRAALTERPLDVELLRIFGSLHDETEPGRGIFPHELVDHAVGDDLIGDVDAQQPARSRIEGRLPQHLRHHLAKSLESRDLGVGSAVAVLLQQTITVRVIERPECLLSDVDAIERRLRQEYP